VQFERSVRSGFNYATAKSTPGTPKTTRAELAAIAPAPPETTTKFRAIFAGSATPPPRAASGAFVGKGTAVLRVESQRTREEK
jgi:hypothetical protein